MKDRRCLRDGCDRFAPVDEFCSSWCAKLHYGTLPEQDKPRGTREAYWKAKARRQEREPYVVVENTEAMNRRLPGSAGTGKR